MNKLTLSATLALIVLVSLGTLVVSADFPSSCDDSGRIDPSDSNSPCKWTTTPATSAEYRVEMEYPFCRHSIYLHGLTELPPVPPHGQQGSFQAWNLSGRRYGESHTLHSDRRGQGDFHWELVEGGVRIHKRFAVSYAADFNVNHDTARYQRFLRGRSDEFLGRFLVSGVVYYRPSEDSHWLTYSVPLADVSAVANLAAHQTLADSCHLQLAVEKQRLIDIAELELETAKIAQERLQAEHRLRVAREVSAEVEAANQAWIAELAQIKAIEQDIQADLTARTIASIETARIIKDEYIAIATLRVTETERRVQLLNQFYAEALQSWMDFEDLANRVWAEIAVNENQIANAKEAIASIQSTFDETERAVNARIVAFESEVSERNETVPSGTPTPVPATPTPSTP